MHLLKQLMLFAAVSVAAAQTTCTDDPPTDTLAPNSPTTTVTIPAISVTSATVPVPATTSTVTSGTATVIVPPASPPAGTTGASPSGSGTYFSEL